MMATRTDPSVEDIEANHETPRPPKRIASGQFAVIYDHDRIWLRIIEAIASGKSLAAVLREPGMPSYARAKEILRENTELHALYEQAKLDRADAMGDEILEIVDQPIPDHLEGSARSAFVQDKRLRASTRMWVAARLHTAAWGTAVSVSVDQRISITAALAAANRRLEDALNDEIDITPPNTNDTRQDGL